MPVTVEQSYKIKREIADAEQRFCLPSFHELLGNGQQLAEYTDLNNNTFSIVYPIKSGHPQVYRSANNDGTFILREPKKFEGRYSITEITVLESAQVEVSEKITIGKATIVGSDASIDAASVGAWEIKDGCLVVEKVSGGTVRIVNGEFRINGQDTIITKAQHVYASGLEEEPIGIEVVEGKNGKPPITTMTLRGNTRLTLPGDNTNPRLFIRRLTVEGENNRRTRSGEFLHSYQEELSQ